MNATADSVPEELLRHYDVSGPRYTSFPTASRFGEAFSTEHYTQALVQRRSGLVNRSKPLSLYVHIPFCESLCGFCACDPVITSHHDRATAYLRHLAREVELHTRHMGAGQAISQLHLGGGSPTFFSDTELRDLMGMLRRNFSFSAVGDYSLEIDPRTVGPARLDVLAELGFTRLSFGVQDLDAAVQRAVHRVHPAEHVFALVAAARERGFGTISLDLMYGLPCQTPESFAGTLAQVHLLRPDRIALYGYTHLPGRFQPQEHIPVDDLPNDAVRRTMLSRSLSALLSMGYVYVGMGHFALPDNALAIAKRQGRLHRSFQGFSTQPDGDLIGLGVSAIGHMGATYSQNAKTLAEYGDRLDHGLFPVVRGLTLTRDDLARRSVIMALVCQGQVQIESIELAYLLDFRSYFSRELQALQPLVEQGLVTVDAADIQLTVEGRFSERAVAMVFDRYLQNDRMRAQARRIH